jgi:hypothetical protein
MRCKTVVVRDTRESLADSIEQLYQALKKGGGIGFDLRHLSKSEQAEVVKGLEQKSEQVLQQTARRQSC